MVTTTPLGWCHHCVSHSESSVHYLDSFKINPHTILTLSIPVMNWLIAVLHPYMFFPYGKAI
jgi:hypothetical protein